MRRANQNLFPCDDCKFRCEVPIEHPYRAIAGFTGVCKRNPPTFIPFPPTDHRVTLWALAHPPVTSDGSTDCFAGEPKVKRSCATCRHDENDGSVCMVSSQFDLDEWNRRDDEGWHCSDWEEKE